MNKKIHLVDIQTLIAHERTSRARVGAVQLHIRQCGVVNRPVIVDKNSGVILDGHHRVQALKAIGALKAPVLYVNYMDKEIEVYLRRKEILMDMLKQYVVARAMSHTLFPIKTTRHSIKNGRGICRIPIADLMR